MHFETAPTPTAPIQSKDGLVLGSTGTGKTVALANDFKDYLARTTTEGEQR